MELQFALCVPFIQGDIWVDRLERLGASEGVKVYEYNRPEELAALPNLLCFNAVWVVMDGTPGMEAVYLIRERHREVDIVWVSDNVPLGDVDYSLQVCASLHNTCTDEQLGVIIRHCRGAQASDCMNL